MNLHHRLVTAALLAAALSPSPLTAQRLVADIGPNQAFARRIAGTQLATLGSRLLDVRDDGIHGAEVWVSDGTVAGASLLRDVEPGAPGSDPQAFVVLGTRMLFVATTVARGTELWSTDGTPTGTTLVGVLGTARRASPALATAAFGKAWIAAARGEGCALHVTDGTPAGTRLLAHFAYFGRSRFAIEPPVAWEGRVWFSASQSGDDDEVWTSDGSSGGTRRVADLTPGAQGSFPGGLTATPFGLVFAAEDPANGRELFVLDPGTTTPRLVADAAPGPAAGVDRVLGFLGGEALALGAAAGTRRPVLVRTRGTAASTIVVGAIAQGSAQLGPKYPCAVTHRAAFFAVRQGAGEEVIVTDGTLDGTHSLAALLTGGGPLAVRGLMSDGERAWITVARGTLPKFGELWVSDGTAQGTRLLHAAGGDRFLASSSLVRFGARRAFLDVAVDAFGLQPPRAEAWISDGTQVGTFPYVPASLRTERTSDVTELAAAGDRVVFFANDGVHGREPWCSDGTAAGTRLLLDLEPGAGSPSGLLLVCSLGARVLISATTSTHGPALWITDGTPQGTTLWSLGGLLAEYHPPAVRNAEEVYFLATLQGVPGIHACDERGGNLRFVAPASSLTEMVLVDGVLHFTYQLLGPSASHSLFRLDPGSRALQLLLRQRGAENWIHSLREHRGRLAFVRDVDGSESVTLYDPALRIFDDLEQGLPAGAVAELASADGFVAWTRRTTAKEHGAAAPSASELWVSPGPQTSPRVVYRTSERFPSGPGIAGLQGAGVRVLFGARDAERGGELWASDGTVQGTRPLTSAMAGSGSALVPAFTAPFRVGSAALHVFTAQDPASGLEAWITDGTSAGTRRLGDLEPGPGSAEPRAYTRAGTRLWFLATTQARGEELHEITLPELGAALAEGYGQGCAPASLPVPQLTAAAAPVVGNLGYAVGARSAPALAPAVWIVGPSRAEARLASCTLLVAAPWSLVAQTTTSAGEAVLPVPLPPDPTLLGVKIFVQAAFAAGSELALSDGVRLLVGAR